MPGTAMDLSRNIISRILKLDSVIMKDSNEVGVKLMEIIADGPEKLQVIADYDSTLTKSHINGKPTTHSIDVLNKVPTLSEGFLSGCGFLFRKYNELAYSPELPEEQKQQVLNDWWTGYVSLLTKEYVTLEDIQLSTETINTPLRDGWEEMFSLLSQYQVPVVVVSAGIGDVISHKLRNFQPTIFANFLQIQDNGKISGFKEPYVSVYNKHKIALPVDPTRHNVILMGDSLGDCYMADNIHGIKTVLKIGFFSQQDEAALEKYRNRYDIVLVEDQTMNVPNALFTQILAYNKS